MGIINPVEWVAGYRGHLKSRWNHILKPEGHPPSQGFRPHSTSCELQWDICLLYSNAYLANSAALNPTFREVAQDGNDGNEQWYLRITNWSPKIDKVKSSLLEIEWAFYICDFTTALEYLRILEQRVPDISSSCLEILLSLKSKTECFFWILVSLCFPFHRKNIGS